MVVRERIAGPLGLEIDLDAPAGTPVATVADLDLDRYEPAVRVVLQALVLAARDPSTLCVQAFLAQAGQSVIDWIAEHVNNPAVLCIESPFDHGAASTVGSTRALRDHSG